MNNSKFNKVDWINIIIFKIFQDYFNLKELQDLSMLSKLTRSKLKPILFKSIHLITEKRFIDDSLVEFFNSKSYSELNKIVNLNEDAIQKNLDIQNSLSNINSELQDIKNFANSLYIYDMKLSDRYLCQIVTCFTNLSVLKINCSTIKYSIFQKLGEYFPMLKTFGLFKVILLKESTGSDNSNEIIFPFNLKNLSIWCVEVTSSGIPVEHYRVDFNDIYYDTRTEYILPNIYLPSLKNLQFLGCAAENNGLKEFLETNPNLEELSIDTFNPSMSKNFKSLKSLYLEQIEKFENLENLIVNYNIKALKIIFKDDDDYDKLEKICLMCPSVEFLRFTTSNFGFYDEVFNTFLVPILKKLPNLKTLELPIDIVDRELELIDINHFPQIEKIIFETEDLYYLKILFEENCNLKKIEIKAFICDINKEEFLEVYKSYIEWKFKFFDDKVIGIKIK